MNDRRSVEQKLDGGEERTLLRHISPCLFFSAIISVESGRHGHFSYSCKWFIYYLLFVESAFKFVSSWHSL